MSSEIVQFVEQLLKTPAGTPYSVQLMVDTDGDVHAFFEALLLIMTEILKKWYKPPITISAVSHEDLGRLIDYFASFGVKFRLDVSPVPRVLRLNNREYLNKSRLDDMKFQMVHSDNLYTVTFSMLSTA
jgi:hypothetical protein